MQALNINAHRAQLAREPGKYLGHLPNGSGIQAHSAADHFAAYGIIMEIHLDAKGRIYYNALLPDGRRGIKSRSYTTALNVGIAILNH